MQLKPRTRPVNNSGVAVSYVPSLEGLSREPEYVEALGLVLAATTPFAQRKARFDPKFGPWRRSNFQFAPED